MRECSAGGASDDADADTQGAIGYMFQGALYNEFNRRGLVRKLATLITQVLVDPKDPAFKDPSKPIGAYMEECVASKFAADLGWVVGEDGGRGWHRMVASPQPQRIIELDVIKSMIDFDYIVVACGMGLKICAVITFLESTPHGRAMITDPPNLGRALTGAAGTHIVPGA